MSLFLQISGLFLGVFTRTYLPYIRKLKRGVVKKFDSKYIFTALYSFVIAFLSVILIIPEYNLINIKDVSLNEGLKIFCTSFTFGFTWNSILNEGSAWGAKK